MAGSSSISGDESIIFADNASFDGTERGGKLTTDGQLWVGSTTSPHVQKGTITSPNSSITVGYSSPNITLTVAGGAVVDSLGVQATSGTGTDPVLPTVSGVIEMEGALIASGTNPLRAVSTAANTLQYQVQTSQALAAPDSTKVGVSNFSRIDFAVDSNGFVQSTGSQAVAGTRNIGITYSAGTGVFTICGQDGTALSASNPAFVTLQDRSDLGLFKTYTITANQDFIDDNGASEIIGNLFGLTTGIASTPWPIPFFIYAVTNDAETAIAFMISRFPNTKVSPVAAKIGMPSTAAADSQGSFFSLENVTAADYESNPCKVIGSFRMIMSASDDWTVQTLSNTDGIGRYQEGVAFVVTRGQFGAATSKYFQNNGGTAPDDADGAYTYKVTLENRIFLAFAFNSMDTAGVGAVTLRLALPFLNAAGAIAGNGYFFQVGVYSALTVEQFPSTQYIETVFVNSGGSGKLQNQNLDVGTTYTLGFNIEPEFT